MGRFLTASLVPLLFPLIAAAQHQGAPAAAPPAPRVAAPRASAAPRVSAPMHAPHASSAQPAVRIGSLHPRSARPIRRANGIPFNAGQIDFQDAPGLGFDFPHLAAVGNGRNHSRHFANTFPFGFGGFLLSPSVIIEEAQPQQALAEDESSPEPDVVYPGAERQLRARTRAVLPPEPPVRPAPISESEQYVFVRRDGGLVFAVAYSWDKGTLRYVTPEGLRRTVTADALDLAATQQFNEQRGLIFRSPA